MNRRRVLSVVLFMSAPCLAWQQRILKISALANGTLLADGKKIDLDSLDRLLGKFKAEEGLVWYYRENASQEPTAQAMQAIKLIAKHGLPVSMSTKADFSDYVDASGSSRPRP